MRGFRRIVGLCGAAALGTAADACTSPPPATAPLPAVFLLAVPSSPDSAVRLVEFALGEIEGTLRTPLYRPTVVTVSKQYTRNRELSGGREVAVVAAVGRRVADTLFPLTVIELRAWVIDLGVPPARRVTPQTYAGMTPVRDPRAITVADTTDWQALDAVLQMLVKHGARRLP
jgi:hypothetical protein